MTRRVLRDVMDVVAAAGGLNVTIEEGARHTRVCFFNSAGAACFISVHKGSNPKRYEDVLRSQLRRMGLKP
jgi:hypothetical protein